MKRGARRYTLMLLLACFAPSALSAGVGSTAEERARIRSERSAAQSAFVLRERDCQNDFVVTSCVDAARRDLRDVQLRLRRQEALLDEMLRRERAAQRMETIRNRPVASEPATRSASAAAAAPRVMKPQTPRARAHPAPMPKVSAAERQRAETLSEQKFEAASQAAKARREAVEQRNVERAAKGKTAAPLPVPAGASAP